MIFLEFEKSLNFYFPSLNLCKKNLMIFVINLNIYLIYFFFACTRQQTINVSFKILKKKKNILTTIYTIFTLITFVHFAIFLHVDFFTSYNLT